MSCTSDRISQSCRLSLCFNFLVSVRFRCLDTYAHHLAPLIASGHKGSLAFLFLVRSALLLRYIDIDQLLQRYPNDYSFELTFCWGSLGGGFDYESLVDTLEINLKSYIGVIAEIILFKASSASSKRLRS